MKRSEVNENLKWDLAPLFENEQKWQESFDLVDSYVQNFYSNKETLASSIQDFVKYYKSEVELDNLTTKLYMYAHLSLDSETTNSTWQKNMSKLEQISEKYANEFAEVENEVKENVDKILEIVNSNPQLQFLEKKYLRIKEDAKHMLSEEEEKILSKLNGVFSTSNTAFSALDNQDFKLDDIEDSEGNLHPLTHASLNVYLESKDAVLRENAWKGTHSWYKKHRNTYANNLYYNFKSLNDVAKLRGFDDALSSSLYADRSNRKVLDTLFESVNENVKTEQKYLKLFKKLSNLDELNRWDLSLNPIEMDFEYTIEEQKDIMINISRILKGDYETRVKQIFDQRWIDWKPNEAKRSGAYSSGYQKSNKYILLNDTGNLNSLSTLVHEIGHSMHSIYASENNSYEYGHYTIMEAEVASTLNELILFDYLITVAKTKQEKMVYLLNLIGSFRGTVYRQAMFAQFEVKVNDRINNNEMLTAKDFEDIYEELLGNFFGEEVKSNDLWKYECYRIPHFFYNFYVYKYSTGFTSALAIYNNLKQNYDETLEKIYSFLKTGSKFDPLDVIKKAGVDLENKQTYELAFNQFEKWVDQLEQLMEDGY